MNVNKLTLFEGLKEKSSQNKLISRGKKRTREINLMDTYGHIQNQSGNHNRGLPVRWVLKGHGR